MNMKFRFMLRRYFLLVATRHSSNPLRLQLETYEQPQDIF
ncbi:hypothetical protein AVAK2825_11690 [Acidovorax sp. SUPP2825]|nr:hypothetical protein AVAK2825_11690 [Acidovorax sp. SUPP2825]